MKEIKLTPRFTDSRFDGYNQVDGTHFFDNAEQVYSFVEKSAYDELVRACDGLFEALRAGGDSEEGHALIQLGITLTKLRGSVNCTRDESCPRCKGLGCLGDP